MRKPEYTLWVDVNGTLVNHRPGSPVWDDKGEVIIGVPVMAMVDRVRRRIAAGEKVVLKSAMMSDSSATKRAKVEKAFGDWSEKWLGKRLEVTATCRPEFYETWDDKSRRVVRNAGQFADTKTGEMKDGMDSKESPARRSQVRRAPAGGRGVPRLRDHFGDWADREWGEWPEEK